MNKKVKIVASATATIAMCASLAVGGTFALFTSESKVNVAINSGKVEIVANVENLALYSPKSIKLDGTIEDPDNAATETAFVNGGTASITDGNVVELYRMTPGDKATFDIVVKNNSDVTVQYQTKLEMLEGIDLFSGLIVTLEKDGVSTVYDGMTAYSNWAELTEPGEVERTTVTIELPANAGNQYQGLTCKLAFTVNAVQGNAAVTQLEEGVTYLYNASDLRLFEKSVNDNGNTYAGKTVKLMADVDLAGLEWKPVGQTTGYSAATYFQGTFDGNGKTISNLTIGESSWEAGSNEGKNFATGFFGFIEGSTTIKNVTFDKANVEGHHWVGVVAGYMTGTVSDVTVTNSTVTSSYKTSEADGDKAGGIVGYLNSGSAVTGCTVSGSTITAVRDNGSVVGYSTASGSVTGNTAENCTVYYSTDNSAQIGGKIAGKRAEGVSNNTATNVTVTKLVSVATAKQLSAALNATYSADTTILLTSDIDLAGVEWVAHILKGSNNSALTIDGNGKTIYGLTSSNYNNGNGFNSNGLVTCIMSSLYSVTFKNLTVSGANLSNNGGWNAATGVFVGDINTVKVTFDTCTVTGATVTSDAYAAGFVGYAQDVYVTDPDLSCPLILKNCSVTNSIFNGSDATGALVGLNNGSTIINDTTVTGNTINGGAGYSAAALVGASVGTGTTATNVTVSGNTYSITDTRYQVSDATYGYIYHNDQTYTVNGTALN